MTIPYLALLGYRVRDVVTGYEGVCESISFDLYGCVQAVIRPKVTADKPTEIPDGRFVDLKRLVQIGGEPVMPVPTFDVVPGCSEKPAVATRAASAGSVRS